MSLAKEASFAGRFLLNNARAKVLSDELVEATKKINRAQKMRNLLNSGNTRWEALRGAIKTTAADKEYANSVIDAAMRSGSRKSLALRISKGRNPSVSKMLGLQPQK